MRLLLTSRRLFLHHRRYYAAFEKERSKARVLLLPEVPTDTADTNKFIAQIENSQFPDLQSWPLKDAVNGTAKFGLEHEGWLLEYLEQLTDEQAASFRSLIEPIESQCTQVDFAWYTFCQRYMVTEFGNKNVESHGQGLQKLITRLLYNQYMSPEYYKALKNLLSTNRYENEWQKRQIEHDLLECHLNAVDLKPHQARQVSETREYLEKKKNNYMHNLVNSCIKIPTKYVEDFSELSGAPEHVLRVLADQPEGPLELPLTIRHGPRRYAYYLQYCKKRMQRQSWWHATNSRAAFDEDTALFNNSSVVEEIRAVREREAKFLGYSNFAEVQLRLCMAKSVDEVKEFLSRIGEKASDKLDSLYEDMCKMMDADGDDSTKQPPDAYDLTYYSRRVADSRYRLSHHQFAEYFPYPQTMENILSGLGKLFGIQFHDVSQTIPRWHPTVQVFEVRMGGKVLSHLFIDPYARQSKPLSDIVVPGRPKSDIAKTTPFAYLNLALNQPSADKPSLIYMDQLASMAYQLGRALQNILSSAEYSTMQGDKLIEVDCKHVCARVLELLIVGRPEFLVEISRHYQNGQKIDLDMATKHVKGRIATNLPTIVREVLESELDISMYSNRLFWRDMYRDLHTKYLPYKWDGKKGDEFVCNMGGFVTEMVASKYYSTLWAKKLASDIVEAFDEAKSNEESKMEVGKRFADIYLFNGGQYSQGESIKKFRGRDPSLEAMEKFYTSY